MGIGATNVQQALGNLLTSVGGMLGGGQPPAAAAAPAQQQTVGLPTADQFQANPAGAGPAAAAGPGAAGAPAGGDQLQQALGQLVQMLQQLVQALTGGAGAQGGAQGGAAGDPNAAGAAGAAGATGADAGTAVANAGPGQTVTSVSPDGRSVATASATAGASASASASAGGDAAAASPASAASPGSPAGAAAAAAAAAAAQNQGGGFLGGMFGGGDDPLMFDLDGKGAGFDTNSKVSSNLNGQGAEQVNDLKAGTGLLTFDATPKDGAATTHDAGKGELSHTFGNKTDLSAYGIKGDKPDGTFSNGFAALRAAGEHFGMIRPGKEFLDGNDMKALESKIGLKMRTGGVNGQDKSLGDLGISRIDLGKASATQSKEQGSRDANGNIIQQQQGANFTVNGQQRSYVDGWFRPDGAARA